MDEGLLELQKQHIHNQREERETLLEQMASVEEERSSLKQVRRFHLYDTKKVDEDALVISQLKEKYLVLIVVGNNR